MLGLSAPGVAAEAPVTAEHPMAWQHDADRVGAEGVAYGAARLRLADCSGHVAVAGGRPVGHGPEHLQDLPGERRGQDRAGGEVYAPASPLQVLIELAAQGVQAVRPAKDTGRKRPGQVLGHCRFVIVGAGHYRAGLGHGEHQLPEAGVVQGVGDVAYG